MKRQIIQTELKEIVVEEKYCITVSIGGIGTVDKKLEEQNTGILLTVISNKTI